MAKRTVVVSEADLLGACTCVACRGLLAEAGPEIFPFYRRRLVQRYWAGKTTPAEQAYQRAHAPWMQAAVSAGARLAETHGLTRKAS
jgi:hypothetical protein